MYPCINGLCSSVRVSWLRCLLANGLHAACVLLTAKANGFARLVRLDAGL
jgi:hypothetical protein